MATGVALVLVSAAMAGVPQSGGDWMGQLVYAPAAFTADVRGQVVGVGGGGQPSPAIGGRVNLDWRAWVIQVDGGGGTRDALAGRVGVRGGFGALRLSLGTGGAAESGGGSPLLWMNCGHVVPLPGFGGAASELSAALGAEFRPAAQSTTPLIVTFEGAWRRLWRGVGLGFQMAFLPVGPGGSWETDYGLNVNWGIAFDDGRNQSP